MGRAAWIIAESSPGRDGVAERVRSLGFEVTAAGGAAAPPEGALVLVHDAVDPRPLSALAPIVYGDGTPLEALSQRISAGAEAPEALLALFVHDLNNPLGAARIVAELLRGDAAPDAARDLADLLRAVDEAVLIAEGLSGHLRALDGPGPLSQAPFDLGQAAADALDRPAFRHRVALSRPAHPVVMTGNRDAVSQAIRDVAANARRMAGEEEVVEVVVGEDRSVRVRAQGFAVPKDLHQRLTEPFGGLAVRERRVPVAPFGLAFAAWAAEAHGGRVVVSPRDDGIDVALLLG